jgi:hypothetical protein
MFSLPTPKQLDQECLNLALDGLNLRLELAGLVGGDGASDDGTRHIARASQGGLGRNEYIRNILTTGRG